MSRFKKLLAAAIIPAVAMVSAPAIAKFSSSQQKEIEGIVGDYLQSNPQVIIKALQEFQRKQMQEAEQTIKNTQKDASKFVNDLFRAKNDPIAGNPKGSVTLVEFFDYQCPHCVDMNPTIKDAIKANPNLRVIFKEFPIRGPLSSVAARAALAANMQGKYMAFHDTLMETKQPYTQESIMDAAKKAGLNMSKLEKDMDSKEVKDQLENNMALARQLKLIGTPAFFLGKTEGSKTSKVEYIPGVIKIDRLNDMIKKVN